MKKWKARENFMNLIVAVGRHSPSAALWILEHRRELGVFYTGGDLSCCFDWEATPQGYNYWNELHKQVGHV